MQGLGVIAQYLARANLMVSAGSYLRADTNAMIVSVWASKIRRGEHY